MEIIRSLQAMQKKATSLKTQGKKIGFVPTMGYLHDGHASLMKQAREENDVVIVSIFVNPLQFGVNEDFDKYPRDEEKDRVLAKKEAVDILFMPTAEDMYPNKMGLTMDVVDRVGVLCDRSRPGHFKGVLTVLSKLFHLTLPDQAYFGMKDAQQVAVVDLLVKDLNFPLQIRMVPTVRETNGLAKSSRNVYLTTAEKTEAIHINQSLQLARQKIIDGEKNPAMIVNVVTDYLTENTTGAIDYIDLLSYPELTVVTTIDQQVIIAVAIQFSQARLIDNIIVTVDGECSPVNIGGMNTCIER